MKSRTSKSSRNDSTGSCRTKLAGSRDSGGTTLADSNSIDSHRNSGKLSESLTD